MMLRDYRAKGAGYPTMLFHRRELLATAAWFVAGTVVARASAIGGRLPWHPNAGHPPLPPRPGPWLYFTSGEAAAVEAIADRIIPPDSRRLEARTPAAVFILIGSWQVRMDATRVFITSARFKKVPSRRERNRHDSGRALSQGARGARPPLPFEV